MKPLVATASTVQGFVDAQVTSTEVLAIQCAHGRIGTGCIREFDETKTTGAAGISVCNHGHRISGSVLREQVAKVIFSRIERQVPDIQLLTQIIVLAATHSHQLPGNEESNLCRFAGRDSFQARRTQRTYPEWHPRNLHAMIGTRIVRETQQFLFAFDNLPDRRQ